MTFMVVYTDGRTSTLRSRDGAPAGDDGLTDARYGFAFAYGQTPPSDIRRHPLPDSEGRFTAWTLTRGLFLRNTVGSLLLPQMGAALELVRGPVVITGNPTDPPAWAYLETLVEDIARVLTGLPPVSGAALATPEWASTILLVAAVLNDPDALAALDAPPRHLGAV